MKPFGHLYPRNVMNALTTLVRHGGDAKRAYVQRQCGRAVTIGVLTGACSLAHAVDGCTVLLCLAAPSWRAIPQCVPLIRQLFHDLARGRAFPTCAMQGTGNSARHQWASAPSMCPPQYTHFVGFDGAPVYRCDYTGVVSVSIDGSPFARTWWNPDGNAVTEFSPAAKAQLRSWDSQFDVDYAAWLATQKISEPGEQR
jgi:hypothetical protein